MILILAGSRDTHADQIEQLLRQREADVIRFDSAAFPSQAELSLSYTTAGQTRYTLHTGAEPIDLGRLRSIWYRFPNMPVPHGHVMDRHQRNFLTEECLNYLQDAWHSLDCLWVPAPPFVVQRAEFKAAHLKVAAAVGFELPPTLFTNSPCEFLEFYRQHNGQVVSKLAGFAMVNHGSDTFSRYTEVVSKRDVGYARAARYCPTIFQAYVPKQVELRITVVGRKVFPVEIRSQETNHTRHDWRRYDHFKTPYYPHELPSVVGQRCVQLVERLGLCYGAIDMIQTPDGRYVFLEINPQGQYQWLEHATGLPINDAICDLLLTGGPGPSQAGTYSPSKEKHYHDGCLAANAV